jgi:hypothetical protein
VGLNNEVAIASAAMTTIQTLDKTALLVPARFNPGTNSSL